MFNISHQLNKQAKATVLFVAKNFDFIDYYSCFSKIEIDQINLFKNDISDKDILTIDLIDKKNKKKIIIYKLKDNLTEYDYQKIGGIVFDSTKSYESINILADSETQIKKNLSLFSSNFWLGFFSKSYIFKNYKFKKKKNEIVLKNISFLSYSKKTFG